MPKKKKYNFDPYFSKTFAEMREETKPEPKPSRKGTQPPATGGTQ